MKIEEFQREKKLLQEECNKKQFVLSVKFAMENSAVTMGDIVRDNIGSVKVDDIRLGHDHNSNIPCCVYYGFEYTTKGVQFKSYSRRGVYQGDVKKITSGT